MTATELAPAVGIHAHKTRKLGRRPSKDAAALDLGKYLTGVVPSVPTNVDNLGSTVFGLYKNDVWGICGPTSVANSRREVIARIGNPALGPAVIPSQDDVNLLYSQSTSPPFDPATGANDDGVDMQTMLEALVKHGIGAGKDNVKPLCFAKVNVASQPELDAAIAIFGFLLFGVDLETAQQAQTDQGAWTYHRSGEWGGHAILGGKYVEGSDDAKDGVTVVTWAELVRAAPSFLTHQLQEAWVVIWPEHLGDKQFLAGVDLPALKADYKQLTGRDFPTVTPPTPKPTPPAPVPTPTPEPPVPTPPAPADDTFAVGPFSDGQLTVIERRAAKKGITPDEYLTWLCGSRLKLVEGAISDVITPVEQAITNAIHSVESDLPSALSGLGSDILSRIEDLLHDARFKALDDMDDDAELSLS